MNTRSRGSEQQLTGAVQLDRLRRRFLEQEEALVRLARNEAFAGGDLDRALRAAVEEAARMLDVERVGVWFFSPERDRIHCADLFVRSTGKHEHGGELRALEFPGYFAALEEDRAIAADDAREDPRTAEFRDAYLVPHGIGGMLDAPVRAGGRVVGIVCHEHVGGPREWTAEEQSFAGSIADLIALAHERSERVRAELQLRESQNRLSSLLESLPHVVLYETGGGREYVSGNIEMLLGVPSEELTRDRMAFPALVHPEDIGEIQRRIKEWHAQGEPGVLVNQFRVRVADGSYRWIEDHIIERRPADSPPYMAGVMIDVTARKRAEEERAQLEEQLVQAQKMEAVGNLAGGIAHDFNNLLTGILGYACLLREYPGDQAEVLRAADVIEGAARNAAELTGKLLGFARKGKQREVPVDLHGIVRQVIELLERTIDKNIAVRCELAADRAIVSGDPAQMTQVLLNLALNARDAMPEGGELVFASHIEESSGGVGEGREDETAERVVLSVSDTGHGVPHEKLSRIFDPFFTTKELGKGSGMGLPMVYGIVKNHGGDVAVHSEPGHGARFEVSLPLSADADVDPSHDTEHRPDRGPAKGRGRVLLVDDEAVVRRVTRDVLEHLGYEVVDHANGRQAAEWFREHRGEVDLALVDMIMPGMDGRACIRALRSVEPGLPALLSTGYGLEGAPAWLEQEGVLGLVPKPYRMEELAAAVARALAEGSGGGALPHTPDDEG
jgi:PAS domain S-box-containing protein